MEHTPKDCPDCGVTFMPNKFRGGVSDATHLGCPLHQAAPALLSALEPFANVPSGVIEGEAAYLSGLLGITLSQWHDARAAILAAKGD